MRSVPLIGVVTIAGTALSLFLIMITVMLEDVKVAPIAPESNRARFLYTGRQELRSVEGGNTRQTPYAYKTMVELFGDIPNMEALAIFSQGNSVSSVKVPQGRAFMTDFRHVNYEFWKVFDFTFVAGRPFNPEEFNSGAALAVITEDLARKLFGTTDVAGREIIIDQFRSYKVVGVVKDVPTVADSAYAQIWIPLSATGEVDHDELNGSVIGIILADREGRRNEVRAEIMRRREIFNARMKELGWKHHDLGAPYLVTEFRTAMWNGFQDGMDMDKVRSGAIIFILLLVPAINLSSMTQSRLRRRVREIGVRRAVGCTRSRLVREIIAENFILTLAGGIIGVVASLIFTWLGADFLWSYDTWGSNAAGSAFVSLTTLLNWRIALYTIVVCFVLNLLSSGIPAWRAACMKPVDAIGGLQK